MQRTLYVWHGSPYISWGGTAAIDCINNDAYKNSAERLGFASRKRIGSPFFECSYLP